MSPSKDTQSSKEVRWLLLFKPKDQFRSKQKQRHQVSHKKRDLESRCHLQWKRQEKATLSWCFWHPTAPYAGGYTTCSLTTGKDDILPVSIYRRKYISTLWSQCGEFPPTAAGVMVLLCFILQPQCRSSNAPWCRSSVPPTAPPLRSSRGEDKADEHAAANGWKMAYTNSVEATLEKSSAKSNKAAECISMPAEVKDMVWSCLTLNFIRWCTNRKDLLGT